MTGHRRPQLLTSSCQEFAEGQGWASKTTSSRHQDPSSTLTPKGRTGKRQRSRSLGDHAEHLDNVELGVVPLLPASTCSERSWPLKNLSVHRLIGSCALAVAGRPALAECRARRSSTYRRHFFVPCITQNNENLFQCRREACAQIGDLSLDKRARWAPGHRSVHGTLRLREIRYACCVVGWCWLVPVMSSPTVPPRSGSH